MPSDKDPITSFREISSSSPKRTRPTDKQMGLGTNEISSNKKDTKTKKDNT